ncbi:polysaccharide biosynthesis/export family protein [Vibrio mangrovi]|uniref:Polysaccharide biosynthesis/export family protein n=1 Tax=Vibrio mangrovi TaxID=474394 RepID=A0A1Y6IUH2_9VIBR|nr:polysaccharide biosynthesis/export family protein [Vibrio mangrovi]MDW6003085.1 polysaccharide biosynthesis/export family protein [Vibrio mangrovi]SMS01327.1 Polysaccharide biosynthesis/export protein [Vibrio mangrovi]
MLKIILKGIIACCIFFSFFSSAAEYRLGAGDTIRISVYGEPDLSYEQFIIDSGETMDYPYLGSLDLKKKTLRELRDMIVEGLKGDYLIDPKVTVNIVQYRNIYVNGVVNSPGGYEYQPGLTVQKAIALAGGFLAKYRKTRGIYLTKEEETEGLSQDQIQELLKGKHEVELNEPVHPGDTIYVVSSFW